ncbi:hypothetical protein A1Q1_03049 [Trichosporon asahii var. asahii CBS 2479]|uniref:Uncharacterized protein n=1 Tax=Trichosporon asahii var. asahii (strain ATCC 90039 / CBS 2479 / JCM 2466 / KCTC 7840 / NBRC 103889/ NCYC 2677 / UAMH 7654) TaxID=1186058 RepID=J4UL05_TRIAS|nr:hypothetical protein A1Q1_03049 [Trichosporon asahii var. asahii CBS 2479]EJT52595.1 hypothetical protein A1Q1_03049 [Trichosporon asahii var. asahii CBS 2479]
MHLQRDCYCPRCGTRTVTSTDIEVYEAATLACDCNTTLVISDTLDNVPETLNARLPPCEIILKTPTPTIWYPWSTDAFRRSRPALGRVVASLPLVPVHFYLQIPDTHLPDLIAYHDEITEDRDLSTAPLLLEQLLDLFPFVSNAHDAHDNKFMVTESGAQWRGRAIGSHRLFTVSSVETTEPLDPASCILSLLDGRVRPHTCASLVALRIMSTSPLKAKEGPRELYSILRQAEAVWEKIKRILARPTTL